jgi:hypothetical protein
VGGKAKSHCVALHVRLRALRACSPFAVRGTALRARAHFALPMAAAAARARRALHSDPRVRLCTTRRTARALVTECSVGGRLPARWIGERRRHIRRNKELREGWGARQGGWRGCEAAGGVHLPLPRLVGRELPNPFGALLRRLPARARLLQFSVSAVRRSAALPGEAEEAVEGLDGPVGAAQQQLRDG